MADINLKDEKRISVNGEYDLVTTHPNNEPIYRSNGHQLELNANNSDYIDLGDNPNISNLSELQLKTKITYENGNFSSRNIFAVGSPSSNNSYVRMYLSDRLIGVLVNINGVTVESQFFQISEFETLTKEFEFKNLDLIVDGVVVKTFGTDWAIDFSNTPSNIPFTYGINNDFNLPFTHTAEYIKVQGETFNPTNINENAQIEGSNGTIAQVNSSAADPINYILGTVFQKSGFALGFDAGNSEYVDLGDAPNISNLSELQLKTKITYENGNFSSRQLFSIGDNVAGADRILFYLSDRSVGLVVGVNGTTVESQFTTISSTFGTITSVVEFKNLELIVDGVVKKTFATDWALDFSFNPNNRHFTYGIENNFLNAFTHTSEYIEVQSERYDFKRGLGVELIGSNGTTAEIKTSAANPQQRVNFGMWLKGDNINGWNPYTV